MSATVAAFTRAQPAVVRHQLDVLGPRMDDTLVRLGRGPWAEVLLVGSGTSHHAAVLAAASFAGSTPWSARRTVRAMIPTDVLHHPGDLVLGPGTLVVGISQSGRSTGTRGVLALARSLGSPTVLVTGGPPSGDVPADVVLDIACGPEPVGAKTKGFTATVVALHTLGLALDGTPVAAAGLDGLPDDLQAVLDDAAPLVDALVDTQVDAPVDAPVGTDGPTSVPVVTWGPWWPVAAEGALKVLEVSRLPVTVHDVEEFLHGPHLALTAGSLLVVVGDESPLGARADALVAFVRDLGARVLDIRAGEGSPLAAPPTTVTGTTSTDAASSDRKAGARHVVRVDLPATRDVLAGADPATTVTTALPAVVPLQLLALALARARGLRPEDDVFPGFHQRLGSKTPDTAARPPRASDPKENR
ncbi:SIS domain-containing protein [Cellulomonas soli]|uniref:SIS domain-containing protein n=1 Tax=Cellulomonas soli TaxID=931535 RepID=A0A512PFA2_9CELL|nr:SIS domain-containing protein [Cellulomonas soli]NYI59344.1 glucosamine--fructose-6-phosphate aminotransferase (isomerizing) [Cellulomonas soli]GEP69868.1 hypothetical protein CSO01_25830 [Cellulomonas soli]